MVGKILTKYRMLLILSSAWMMGTGLRFIIGYFTNYHGGDVPYWMNLFDVLVDWMILFIVGLVLFIVTIVKYLRETKQ